MSDVTTQLIEITGLPKQTCETILKICDGEFFFLHPKKTFKKTKKLQAIWKQRLITI